MRSVGKHGAPSGVAAPKKITLDFVLVVVLGFFFEDDECEESLYRLYRPWRPQHEKLS